MPSESDTFPHAFRMPVGAVLWVMMACNLIGLACALPSTWGLFFKADRLKFLTTVGWMVLLLDVVSCYTVVRIWKVKVGERGVRGFDFWGAFHTVEWSAINRIKPFNFLGLPFARVFYDEARLALWIPLFLVNHAEFVHTVAHYAPETNLLRQHLEAFKV